MDTEKFRIAKGVSDAEVEGERLEGELASLRMQVEGLEREGVEGGRRARDEGEDEVVYVFLPMRGVDGIERDTDCWVQIEAAYVSIAGDHGDAGPFDWRV